MSSYKKRTVVCFALMLCVMLICVLRVIKVATDGNLLQAAVNQSTRKVEVAQLRGNVFDCNGVLLTGKYFDEVTVVLPTQNATSVLPKLLQGDELAEALEKIRNGQPITVSNKGLSKTYGCHTFFVPRRYGGSLTHVLGYIGADGHGVSGVEKAYDGLLYTYDTMSITYTANSSGRVLEGEPITVQNEGAHSSVTLTIDTRIQTIAEQAMSEVSAGAVLVVEAKSGKIKAVVSCPDYDPDDISTALTTDNSPLINRVIYSYNVGSVFKPCVAAAALENGLGDYRYTCTGSIKVGDLTFRCNRSSGHGELGLKEALAYSCNTYFYTLAEKLGADGLYAMAESLSFGQTIDCMGGLVSSKGVLPELSYLQTVPAELTNLSIGQGKLMLSPIQLSNLYCAIVNGGWYRSPYIVQSTEQNETVLEYAPSKPTVAFSESTAEALKDYLKNALQNGTGSAAYSESISAGGKTGTAQTGWVDGDRKILNGWFCGFYDGEETYVIVILKEDVKSGSTDCAPIFKRITENMRAAGF